MFLDTDDFGQKIRLKFKLGLWRLIMILVYFTQTFILSIKKKIYIQNNFNLPSGFITKQILKRYTIGILTVCIKIIQIYI